MVLGDYGQIGEGQKVSRTGEILSTPVGDNFMGRVVNPLGEPIDGLGPIESEGTRSPTTSNALLRSRNWLPFWGPTRRRWLSRSWRPS